MVKKKEKLFCKKAKWRTGKDGKKEKYYIEYLNKSIAFDTETTSTYIDVGVNKKGDVIREKVAFMYIWAVMDDEGFKTGRTWEEFKAWIESIKFRYGLKKDKRCIVYCHNLPFDFSFIPHTDFEITDVFATAEHKIVSCVIDDVVEMRDSAILANAKLAKIAEEVDLKKLKGDLDYSVTRTWHTNLTDTEMMYVHEDVHILQKWIAKKIEEEGDNITKIPLTATGYVRRELKRTCKGKEYVHDFRKLIARLTIRPDEYELNKDAYAGGYTHANKKYVGKILYNVYSNDFASSYPTVLCTEQYPMQKGFKVDIKSYEEYKNWEKDFCIISKIEMTELDLQPEFPDTPLSYSKCDKDLCEDVITDNGRIYAAKTVVCTGTNIDIDLWIKAYHPDTISFGDTYVYRKGYLPKPVIITILTFYKYKTECKDIEELKDKYRRNKAWLNSTYGMMVTDLIHDIIFCEDGEWLTKQGNFAEQIEQYNDSESRCLYYPWGVFCTAYARKNLWTMILEEGEDYVYSDTDSTKYLHKEKHKEFFDSYNKEVEHKLQMMCDHYKIDYDMYKPADKHGKEHYLGIFDEEDDMIRFKTLGAKRYIKEVYNKDGEKVVEITVAGLGKKDGRDWMLTQGDAFDVFEDGMTVPASHTGKLTHTYLKMDKIVPITDCNGDTVDVRCYNGCHLEPAAFNMCLSDDYIDFLKRFN